MYLVDQNNDVITKAQYEFSSIWGGKNCQKAEICQDKNYFVTFWKLQKGMQFWKNQKKQKRIFSIKDIQGVALQNTFIAVQKSDCFNIYTNQIKLITKSRRVFGREKFTFNNQKQIMFQSNDVKIYDFITKKLAKFDLYRTQKWFEYCPINDVILIPSIPIKTKGRFTVWSFEQAKAIHQAPIDQINNEVIIKMAKSGKYFVVADRGSQTLDIYSFQNRIICHKSRLCWEGISILSSSCCTYPDKKIVIQWIQDDNYLFIHQCSKYQMVDIQNKLIIQCKTLKIPYEQTPLQHKRSNNEQKCILLLIEGRRLQHTYSVRL